MSNLHPQSGFSQSHSHPRRHLYSSTTATITAVPKHPMPRSFSESYTPIEGASGSVNGLSCSLPQQMPTPLSRHGLTDPTCTMRQQLPPQTLPIGHTPFHTPTQPNQQCVLPIGVPPMLQAYGFPPPLQMPAQQMHMPSQVQPPPPSMGDPPASLQRIHGHRPCLTPIIENSLYSESQTQTPCATPGVQQNPLFQPSLYNSGPNSHLMVENSLGLRSNSFGMSSIDENPMNMPVRTSRSQTANQANQQIVQHGCSGLALPSEHLARRESQLAGEVQFPDTISKLASSPLTDPHDVVEILIHIPNTTDAIQVFPVHHKLLSNFSPIFRKHLETLADIEAKQKVRMVHAKLCNYNDELAFHRRVEAGPSDLKPYSTELIYNKDSTVEEGSEVSRLPAEDSVLTLLVKIALPSIYRKPRKITLPPAVGAVSPKTFAALVSWLYLGAAFFRHTSACTMIELWVLAGKLGMKTCQNDCIIGIEKSRQKGNVVETGMMGWVWNVTEEYVSDLDVVKKNALGEGTTTQDKVLGHNMNEGKKLISRHECALRNLLIDQCAWFLDEKWLDGVGSTGVKNEEVLGMSVLVDLVARLRTLHRDGGFRAPGLHDLLNIEERRGDRYWVK